MQVTPNLFTLTSEPEPVTVPPGAIVIEPKVSVATSSALQEAMGNERLLILPAACSVLLLSTFPAMVDWVHVAS